MQTSNKENIHPDKSDRKEEFVLDPTMSNFILLDKISRRFGILLKLHESEQKIRESQQKSLDLRFSDLLKLHESEQKIQGNQQKSLDLIFSEFSKIQRSLDLNELLKIQRSIDSRLEVLTKIDIQNQVLLNSILQEQLEEADSGEFITKLDTVTTTEFAFIDTIPNPGHPVKGYAVSNEGPNTIYVAHNAIRGGISPDTVDVTTDISRFQQILSGEEIRFIFNRRRVYNIAILARDGDSTYRLWLTW